MVEVINVLIGEFINTYKVLISNFSPSVASAINVFALSVLISIVAFFIWKFYRTLSQRNLVSLNLRKYNKSVHPVIGKLLAIFLYFIEYIIVLPFLLLVWFAALSIFILLVAQNRTVHSILMITAAMVAAIRILAYYDQEISKDLAKLFPFITFSVFLLSPEVFDLEVILSQATDIPQLFGNILLFLLVIFLIEIILRVFYTILEFWRSEEDSAG